MVQRVGLLCFALMVYLGGFAQSPQPATNNGYSLSSGVVLSTRGMGLGARMSFPAGSRQVVVSLSGTGLHSPYERKIKAPFGGRRYVVGKMNTAHMVALGVGLERPAIALRGGNIGLLSVGGFVNANFAVTRPYYLEIARDPNNTGQYEFVVEAYNPNDPAHTYDGSIYGRALLPAGAAFSVIPGVGTGLYTYLDISHDSYQVSGLLFSLQADLLAKPLQLMATQPASSIFVAATCTLLIGSKW